MAQDNFDKELKQLGMDKKYSAVLAYLLSFLGGAIFLVISKDKFVRFHALQSILYNGGSTILLLGLFTIGLYFTYIFYFIWLVRLFLFTIWIFLMYMAYKGKEYELPLIGRIAKKFSTKEII